MVALRLTLLVTLGGLLAACPPPSPMPADGGDGDADAGHLGGPDAGEAIGDLAQGAPCLIANDLCATGLICSQVFNAPASVGARCWPRCASAGACDGVRGEPGECRTSVDGAGLCVVTADNLGACGDAAAAVCADGQLCVFPSAAITGHCVTPCSPSDPTSCAQDLEDVACGCADGLDCSVEGLRLAAEPEADGVCIAPSSPGDACGVDPDDGSRSQCSPGQRCEATDGGVGSCVAAP
jgi:hypothetical protein